MTLNKLISITAVLTILTFSDSGYTQVEPSAEASALIKTNTSNRTRSLENNYEQELDKWMLKAYEGDPDAQFKVGVLFTNDQFQSADLGQSVYWYKQAARQGHSLAQYNLGHLYLTGAGVKRSETEAMKWWLKAAEQDHPLAQFNLGRAYYLGIGLKEDHSQSRLWFERAANNNEPKSIGILEQLNWSKPGEYKEALTRNEQDTNLVSKITPVTPSAQENSMTPFEAVPAETDSIEEANNGDKLEANEEDSNTNPKALSREPTKELAVPSDDNSAAQDKPNEPELSNNDQASPIAAYTNPAKRSVLITILNDRDQLTVISTSSEWTEVTNNAGFPVWVHRDYINVSGSIGVIQGNAVNARSVPLITNGTIVGRLNNNDTLSVIDKRKSWYRVLSPNNFKAWVRTNEYNQGKRKTTSVAQTGSTPATVTLKGVATTDSASSSTLSINDDDWLFSQPANYYTLQLASLDAPSKVAKFKVRQKAIINDNLHGFTIVSKDILWTYFLYGQFASSAAAKQSRADIKQDLAWVRSFGKLQQNRCIAWKKQIPAPKELNKYCS